MNRKDNRLFSLIVLSVAVLISLLVVYISDISSFHQKTITVGIVIPDSSLSDWDNFKIGLRAKAKENPIVLDFAKTSSSFTQKEYDDVLKGLLDSSLDGVILYYPFSKQDSNVLAALIDKMPVVFIENSIDIENKQYGSIMIDDYVAGKSLGTQIIRNTLAEETVCIAYTQTDMQKTQLRLNGVKDVLKESNYTNIIETTSLTNEALLNVFKNNIITTVIGLDEKATSALIDNMTNIDAKAKVYSFGSTNKSIYYTDIGFISSLIVSNGYNEGYKSLDQIYNKVVKHKKLQHEILDYSIYTGANLFTKINQTRLFPTNP